MSAQGRIREVCRKVHIAGVHISFETHQTPSRYLFLEKLQKNLQSMADCFNLFAEQSLEIAVV